MGMVWSGSFFREAIINSCPCGIESLLLSKCPPLLLGATIASLGFPINSFGSSKIVGSKVSVIAAIAPHGYDWFTASLDRNHCLIILRASADGGISARSAAISIRFLSSSVRRTFIQFGYLLGIGVSRCNFQDLAKHGTRLNKTIISQRCRWNRCSSATSAYLDVTQSTGVPYL